MASDTAVSDDLTQAASADQAMAIDLPLALDLALTPSSDLTASVDALSSVDLALPRADQSVIAPRDLAAIVDLSLGAPDLSVAADLAIADLATPRDLVVADLRAPPDLVPPPADIAQRVFTWKLVGVLNRFPRDPTGVDFVANLIRAPQDNLSWDPMTGVQGVTNLNIAGNFSRRGFGCDCLINNHEYIMAGGGDGVGGAFIEPTYCDVDFAKATLGVVGSPLAVHNPVCAVANSLCYVIGGSSSPNGPYGSTAARVFNPANGMFAAGPALPVPTVQGSAAVGGGKMLVAGGYCSGGAPCPAKNDPSGMNATVLDGVYAADAMNPVWQAQPALPQAVVGGGMVFLSNRFYLVGGAGSAFGPINPSGVLSFAPGDNGWRKDANPPGAGTTVAVMTDGAVVLAVVYENFVYDLYRGTP